MSDFESRLEALANGSPGSPTPEAPQPKSGGGQTDFDQQLSQMAGGPKPRKAAAPELPPEFEKSGKFAGILDSFTDDLVFGYGSRLTALENALLDNLNPWGDTEKPFWERYEEYKRAEEAQQADFAARNPNTDAIARIGGGVGAGVALGAAAGPALGLRAASSVGGRIAQGAGVGAVEGGLYGSSMGDSVVERTTNAIKMTGAGAAGGALGVAVLDRVGRVAQRLGVDPYALYNRLTRSGTRAAARMGEEVATALKAAGIDPSKLQDDFAETVFEITRRNRGARPDDVARAEILNRNQMPQTRDVVTDNRFGDRATLQRARVGNLGPDARDQAMAAQRAAEEAIEKRGNRLIDQSSTTGRRVVQDPVDAAEYIADEFGNVAARQQQEYEEAFQRFTQAGGEIDADAAGRMISDMRAAGVQRSGANIDNIPEVQTVKRQMDDLLGMRDPSYDRRIASLRKEAEGLEDAYISQRGSMDGIGDNPVYKEWNARVDSLQQEMSIRGFRQDPTTGKAVRTHVPLRAIQDVRAAINKELNNKSFGPGTGGADAKSALLGMKGAMDEWIDRVSLDQAEGIVAPPGAIADLRKGVTKFKGYMEQFSPEISGPVTAKVGKVIQAMARNEANASDIVGFIKVGQRASKVGTQGFTREMRRIMGSDSGSMNAIRQSMLHSLMTSKKNPSKFANPDAVAANLERFFFGEDRKLAAELFGDIPGFDKDIGSYIAALRLHVPRVGDISTSGTATVNEAAAKSYLGPAFARIASAIGIGSGNPVATAGAMVAADQGARMVRNSAGRRATGEALKPGAPGQERSVIFPASAAVSFFKEYGGDIYSYMQEDENPQ